MVFSGLEIAYIPVHCVGVLVQQNHCNYSVCCGEVDLDASGVHNICRVAFVWGPPFER